MKDKCDITKSCSFYVSNMHFATMVLPFIKNQLEEEATVTTFLENNYITNIELVLSKLIIKEEQKKDILKINWKNTNINKYSNIEKILKNNIIKNKKNVILVNGQEEYINMVNEFLRKFIEKNNKKLENASIVIMDFFEVGIFNENIKAILDSHDTIFNTSGEHSIAEVFDGYSSTVKAT